MRRARNILLGCCCLVLWCSLAWAASQQIVSSFNSDDEDWVVECANVNYVVSGGNPGGHIELVDNCPSSTVAYLPEKFLGNLSQFSGGVMAFDVRYLYHISSVGSGFGRVQMNGPVYNATYDFAPFPKVPSDTIWTTYYIPFTAAAWKTSVSTWNTLIQDVTTIHVTLGDVAFDNFRICRGIASTFDADGEGWVADGALLEYVQGGGNSGGFISLFDNRGDSFIVNPPAVFRGNLMRFNGGMLSYEIKSLDSAPLTSVGSGFGRITIANGSLNATLDYAPNPVIPSNTEWTTYYAPMNAAAWHVSEQTWQSILSNVTDVYIVLDGAGATIGLDNFNILPAFELASTFDSNEEGWVADGALLQHEPTNGNPDGFISLLDNRGDSFIVFPPAAFRGNLSRFNGGMLSYEIKSLSQNPLTEVGSGFGRINIFGGGHDAMLDYAPYPPPPSNTNWTPYHAPMTAGAWHVTEEVWKAILSDVTDMYITLDGADALIGMDNFRIAPPLATVQSFAASFGRSNCVAGGCQDFDKDGDVDGGDLFTGFQK